MQKTLFILLASIFFLASCKDDDNNVTPASKTYVLVHGAFQGAYAFQFVKDALIQKGQKVVVVELPGHDTDKTPPAGITLLTYRDKVVAAIDTLKGTVVLVGHSMGGMVISAVAEKIPARIERLVYLGAFVPANDQSLFDLASKDSTSQLSPVLEFTAEGTINVSADKLFNIFCQDGTPAIEQLLISKNEPEPAGPFKEKVTLTAGNFGKVPKSYIYTTEDHALSLYAQKQMVKDAGITRVDSLKSSHCPHLSMPDKLVALLIK
jgi:pimeloyl-ACP methyl ester carboxylesterase